MSFPLLVGRYQFVTEIVYLYYNKTHERTASETHSLWFSRLWANAQRTIKDLLYSYLREGFRDVDVFRLAACRREKLGRGFAQNYADIILNVTPNYTTDFRFPPNAFGGGIYNGGKLLVHNSTFTGNGVEQSSGINLGGDIAILSSE